MAVHKDAIQVQKPFPVSDPPVTTAGGKDPAGRPSSLMKLLAFKKKAPQSAVDQFPSERKTAVSPLWAIGAALVGAMLVATAVLLAPRWFKAPAPQSGQLAIVSEPAGAEVIVDGQTRGVAPLNLTLATGAHAIQLVREGVIRSFPVTIKPGAEVMHHVDFAARPVVPDVGQLMVTSEPSGARVTVDGQPRGVTPASIAELTAGQHVVVIHGDAGSVQRIVTIERGQTASLVVSTSQAAFGWLSVVSPVVMQILEDDRPLGTTETARIMMPAGRHTLKLVNARLAFQRSQTIQVPAGGAANLKIDLPDGVANLNALPWAEAWVDGRRVGETPIGNFKLPIGEHEAVFRHPQFGERRQTFVVTAGEPTRIAVDLRK